MQFKTIRKTNKSKIIIGGLISLGVLAVGVLATSLAKYRITQSFNIVNGTLNYSVSDMDLVAMYTITDEGETVIDTVPTSDYILNTEKSSCNVNGVKVDATIEYRDGKLYFGDLTQRGTKCSVYFDIIKDTTVPVIAGVTQTNTDEKTSISVTVNASDDNAVTEYWYAIDGGAAVQGTGSTHTFTGLTAGSSHTISVYVKDAAGNSSTTWSGTMKTKVNGISSGDIIAVNPSEAPSSKFASVATTDEGMFKVADPMYGGTSYYYRGAVTNNYVKFANFCWRIIRINGDGSIRMIYDGTSCHANGTSTTESIAVASQKYNSSSNKSEYVGYTYTSSKQRPTDNATATASNLKTQTDSWYKTNISDKGYGDYVADGKFCNDRNTASGYTWASAPSSTFNYAAYGRLIAANTPSLACDTRDVYILKAGAITADEISFVGGKWGTKNNKYYLYSGQGYWTISSFVYNTSGSYPAQVGLVHSDGQLGSYYVSSDTPGVRPVINLKADTVFSSGDGTLNSPYTVH